MRERESSGLQGGTYYFTSPRRAGSTLSLSSAGVCLSVEPQAGTAASSPAVGAQRVFIFREGALAGELGAPTSDKYDLLAQPSF
jgi:hypothetical protein